MKTKEEKKKSNLWFMLFVLLLISVILCISSFGIATWARYRSVTGSNVEAQIAKWSFKVNGEEEQFADINLADTIAFEHVEKTKIVPGTYGGFDLDIDGRGCEVSLDYYIDMVVQEKPTNLKFYTDSNYTQAIEVTVGNKMYIDGDLLLSETPMQEIRTIYWKWDYRTSIMPSESVLNNYIAEIDGLETLIDEYYNTEKTEQEQQEIIMKINDKIDTYEAGGEVKIQVKVKGVQINPNFALKRIQVTSSKEDIYSEDDTVNFSMEFTENVYGDNSTGSVTNENAPQVTVGFGGTTADNPVSKVASLTQTNLKVSAGENLAVFVGAEGNKINYSYTLKSGDNGDFKVTNITGKVYNRDGKEIDFGTVQSVPEVKGGTATTVETGTNYTGSDPYIKIDERNLKIQVGQSYPLHIVSNVSEERIFTSSKENIATIDNNGVLHGVATGYTTIRVKGKSSGITKAITVRVISPIIELNDCTVSPEEIEIVMGQTGQISVTSNEIGTIEGLTYTSSNTSIATVDLKGKVTAVAVGNTTIIITGKTSGQTKTVDIEVTPAARIYGQYVDIGTSIVDLENVTYKDSTHPLADWRLFKIESDGGMWIILSDYLKSEYLPSDIGITAYNGYRFTAGNPENFVSALKNESSWKCLIKDTSLYNISGVRVKGGFTKEEWCSSWNENESYVTIDPSKTKTLDRNDVGFSDTLYFPYYISGTYGYWLASCSGSKNDNVWCICVCDRMYRNKGRMNSGDYEVNISRYGLRPCIYIPNTVQFNKSGSVWTLAN